MLVESDHWSGHIIDLILCADELPYILSCRIMPEGSRHFKMVYFSIDEELRLPVTENEIIRRWIIPRLKKQN